jgi:hypothetical protein
LFFLFFLSSSTDAGRWEIGHGIYRLLADKEHIYGAEIEVIIEWKRCEAVVCRVLAGIKLDMADKQLAEGTWQL